MLHGNAAQVGALLPNGLDAVYGRVPAIATSLKQTAKYGELDRVIQNKSGFVNTDYNRSILSHGDERYFVGQANNSRLTGEQ